MNLANRDLIKGFLSCCAFNLQVDV